MALAAPEVLVAPSQKVQAVAAAVAADQAMVASGTKMILSPVLEAKVVPPVAVASAVSST